MSLLAHENKKINHFEAIFTFATIGIIVVDINGKIAALNPFALNEFGYTQEELTGKSIEILIPSRYHPQHQHHHKNYIENAKTRQMGEGKELFAVTKKGKEIPVEISLSNYTIDNEKFTIAFVNNVAKRKIAEAEIDTLHRELEATVTQRTRDLKNTLNKLNVSRDKLAEASYFQKAVVVSAGAIIIVTDEKGIIKLFNPEGVKRLGYTEAEVIGKVTTEIFHNKTETERKRNEIIREFGIVPENDFEVFVTKARLNIHEEEEYILIRKNGTSFPASVTISAIKNLEGKITGFTGIAIDISERKKIQQGLEESLKREKELSELKTRFVSMASHEFRTPLSTVLSSAYLIERYTTEAEQQKREKHLQRIVTSVNMLTDILNDFLSVGKIEEGKIQVRLSSFNIQELVDNIIQDIELNLKKNQFIEYIHEGEREVLLDPALLKHIVMNLISNASKFSPEESKIEIKTKGNTDAIILSVKDYGIGIAKEDQKHLMERFFRGINAGNIQGTGLGLHIVAKYAQLLNGTVECKSELEKGTEFIIRFNTNTS